MRVCLDVQSAVGQGAGVGRYTRELARHLPGAAREGELVRAFYFDFHRRGLSFAGEGLETRRCGWCPGWVAQQLWKRAGWPGFDWFAGAADVYHFPNFVRPPLKKGARSVVTIHDVSFLRMPETTEEKNLRWLTGQIGATARAADAIVTDSEFSAREIAECLGVEREKVFPIWLGLAELGAPPDAAGCAEERKKLGLERPYLLHVGTLEPRKNLELLVEAFGRLRGFDGDLVLAGGLGWKTEGLLRAIEESPVRERIRRVSRVGDRALAALYEGAEAFVFPSRYEGFGFPPLEAASRGTPVLCARNSSLPEVMGEAAEWVPDGADAEVWAERIGSFLANGARRAELRVAGPKRAAKFRWEETAEKTWAVYRAVAGQE